MQGMSLVRATVRQMNGYTPGEQPAQGERVIKLNTNENPFPPSEKVMRALREVTADALRRYPNPTADEFRDAAAKVLGVKRDNLMAGNGSDDILTIATRTFIPPGGVLAYPDPTYSLYPVLATLEDARAVAVPWDNGYTLPIEGLIASGAQAIYLANPNAPTGTFVPPEQVARLAEEFDGLLLIDEAYADFADANCLGLVVDYPNVVISRTLSKAYSLAGLRFGYAVAQPQIIDEMMKVKDSYNCDAVSITIATAAIADQESARTTWEYVRRERQRVTEELKRLGWGVLPSYANFVLATSPDGYGAQAYLALKKQGIIVRYFDKPGLTDKIRITIGRSEENDAVLEGIRDIGHNG